MDPLSITASAITVVDVCFKLGQFLIEVKKGSDTVDGELTSLLDEVQEMGQVSNLIGEKFRKESLEVTRTLNKNDNEATAKDLWLSARRSLDTCHHILLDLDLLLTKLFGRGDDSTKAKVRRYFQKQSKESELFQLHQKLGRAQQTLQIVLQAINITYTRMSHADSRQYSDNLSGQIQLIQSQGEKLEAQIAALKHDDSASNALNLTNMLPNSASIKQLRSLNFHFTLPQSVSDMFMGRESALEGLKGALMSSNTIQTTKKFIVYGIGGSGKTQFCCKFAQDNRESFWGVFYVDASSAASCQTSYAAIARTAGIEPNERAVNEWLSTRKEPWLLLIDNLNETDSIAAGRFFPQCKAGLVLVTTRNHSLRTQGNFGPRFYEFRGLEETESTNLLLMVADIHPTHTLATLQLANTISRALGYLPLALIQAGKAILSGRCSLQNCLAFFETSWADIRDFDHGGARQQSDAEEFSSDDAVSCTYEMVVPTASQSATELLKLLSFMHHQNLYLEILIQAALNPSLERDARKEVQAKQARDAKTSWMQKFHDFAVMVSQWIMEVGERSALPKLLHEVEGMDREEVEFRLRKTLTELRDLALVDFVEAGSSSSISVHRLVHSWVRQRMSLKEQAAWCQAACNTLARAVTLPPLGGTNFDAEIRWQTLAHIDHVREQQSRISAKYLRNQQEIQRQRRRMRPPLPKALAVSDIRQYAKFSRVYAETGHWDKARELMLVVDDFLSSRLGLQHPNAIPARLFLSTCHWWLGEADISAKLQFELLDACKASLGEQNLATLDVMDKLGVSLWQQGRFKDARVYQQKALHGLQAVRQSDHPSTFLAMSHLGRVVGKFAEFEEAVKLHAKALEGLKSLQQSNSSDVTDRDILSVSSDLAMARYDRHRYGQPQEDELELAHELQMQVFIHHETHLGREHPETLWACANLARIKAGFGAVEEAEEMIRRGLKIAERNLGETHIGTLFGKTYLGQILLLGDKLEEAEDLLKSVVSQHDIARRDHPDQLVAKAFLLACYQRREKEAEAQKLRDNIIEVVRRYFGDGSPWEMHFIAKY